MTNKVIIDGVDVSECEYYRDGFCYPGTGVCYKCDTICSYACRHYKEQLQRKEQECKELVEKIKNYRLEPSERIDFNRYKQALDKIKEIVTQDYVELNDIIKIINEVKDE